MSTNQALIAKLAKLATSCISSPILSNFNSSLRPATELFTQLKYILNGEQNFDDFEKTCNKLEKVLREFAIQSTTMKVMEHFVSHGSKIVDFKEEVLASKKKQVPISESLDDVIKVSMKTAEAEEKARRDEQKATQLSIKSERGQVPISESLDDVIKESIRTAEAEEKARRDEKKASQLSIKSERDRILTRIIDFGFSSEMAERMVDRVIGEMKNGETFDSAVGFAEVIVLSKDYADPDELEFKGGRDSKDDDFDPFGAAERAPRVEECFFDHEAASLQAASRVPTAVSKTVRTFQKNNNRPGSVINNISCCRRSLRMVVPESYNADVRCGSCGKLFQMRAADKTTFTITDTDNSEILRNQKSGYVPTRKH